MELKNKSIAGTLESSDCLIMIEPATDGQITIELESAVKKQFGKQIERTVHRTLRQLNITSALVKVNDKGALDCVIIARLKAAIMRSNKQVEPNWEV